MAEDSKTKEKTPAEALVAWGDPVAVAEMLSLAEEGYDSPLMIIILGAPPSEDERKAFRYQKLRERLEQALVEKLRNGSLVATGYDPRAAIDALPVAIPADRWRVLIPKFEDSSAAGGGLSISGILVRSSDCPAAPREASLPEPHLRILPEPHLRIAKAARRARFEGLVLKLTPRSFDLLMILAEGAMQGEVAVSKPYIEERLLHANFSDKAIGQDINRLKSELRKSGVSCETADAMIENVRTVGYRLTLSTSAIRIDD